MDTINVATKIHYDPLWDDPDYQPTARQFWGLQIGTNPPLKEKEQDSRSLLISLGFQILAATPRFYICKLPPQWYIRKSGNWTFFFSGSREKILAQFDRFSFFENDSFLDVETYLPHRVPCASTL